MTPAATMPDARPTATHIYRVHIAIAAVVFAALAAGAWASIGNITLLPASSHAIREACHSLLPSIGAGQAVALGMVALGAAVFARAALSLNRQFVLTRRHLSSHRASTAHAVVAGTRCTVFDGAAPEAFCAGYVRPRIFLSTGALNALTQRELHAVVAHERHHMARRDPLRILLARLASDALPFLPALRHLARRYETVAELAADGVAVRSTGSRAPLASAMLKMAGPSVARAGAVGIARERVDHMTGRRHVGRIDLPIAPALASALAALLLGGVVISAWLAAGPINLPLAIAGSCMVLMYSLPLLAVGGGGAAALRRSSSWTRRHG